jgi:hypothetical protein
VKALSHEQRRFLKALVAVTDGVDRDSIRDIRNADIGDGFHVVRRMYGGFSTPTAEACERRGLVELSYSRKHWGWAAKIADAGREAVSKP